MISHELERLHRTIVIQEQDGTPFNKTVAMNRLLECFQTYRLDHLIQMIAHAQKVKEMAILSEADIDEIETRLKKLSELIRLSHDC